MWVSGVCQCLEEGPLSQRGPVPVGCFPRTPRVPVPEPTEGPEVLVFGLLCPIPSRLTVGGWRLEVQRSRPPSSLPCPLDVPLYNRGGGRLVSYRRSLVKFGRGRRDVGSTPPPL